MGMPAPSQPPAMSLAEYSRWLSNVDLVKDEAPKTWKLMKPRVRVPYNKEPTNG